MPETLKVFIGSSTEGLPYAKDIQQLIYEEAAGVEVVGWWADNAFPFGSTFIESLDVTLKNTNASILVASEHDRTAHRGQLNTAPRDNVLVECGMAIGRHGRHRTVLAVVGDPKLPSDFDGVSHVYLQKAPEDREKNRGKIRSLIRQWKTTTVGAQGSVEVVLPALYAAILRVLSGLQTSGRHTRVLDAAAAGLLESVAQQFSDPETQSGITKLVCDISESHLRDADAIWAIDVLGPSAWLKPTAFRYLAIQIREYLRANVVDGRWMLRLSAELAGAIRNAASNIMALTGQESITPFDDQFYVNVGESPATDFSWSEGTPRLEFARVLLWTEDELRSPITESVIAIHEAFHVPLFAVIADEHAPERAFDFIVFKQRSGTLKGFYNVRQQGFVPKNITKDLVPGHGRCLDHWRGLLSHPNLMFASDLYRVLPDRQRSASI